MDERKKERERERKKGEKEGEGGKKEKVLRIVYLNL